MNNPKYVVLYFIPKAVPTPAERQDAAQYGPDCLFRNAAFIDPAHAVEPCTAVTCVTGETKDIPANYRRAFPWAVPFAEYVASGVDVADKIEKTPVFSGPQFAPEDGVDSRDFLPPPPAEFGGPPLELAPGARVSQRQREAMQQAAGWKGNA